MVAAVATRVRAVMEIKTNKKRKKKSVFNNIAENFPVNIKLRISERKSKLPYRRPKVS
jgi:hypothetical protein